MIDAKVINIDREGYFWKVTVSKEKRELLDKGMPGNKATIEARLEGKEKSFGLALESMKKAKAELESLTK